MTRYQEHFDAVLAHLRKQGHPTPDGCFYRHPTTSDRCGIGALIPDDKYSRDLEGRSTRHHLVLEAIGATKADEHFYAELQYVLHDSLDDSDFLETLEENARDFAIDFDLTYKAPTP